MTSPRVRLAFLLAGGLLLAVLLARVDLGALRAALRRTAPAPLGAALGFLGLNVLVKAGRWRWMIRRLTGHALGLGDATEAILAGVAAASVSPARTVDLAKPVLLRQRFDIALSASTAAVLVERFMDGVSLVVLFGAALALGRAARGPLVEPALLASVLLLAGGAAVLAAPRALRAAAGRLFDTLPLSDGLRSGSTRVADAMAGALALWRLPANLGPLVAWSVAAALCEAARLAAVFAALGLPLGLAGGMLSFSAANLVAVVALIPGGIGVTELSMAAVAGLVLGQAPTSAGIAAAVLVDRALSYYLVVAAGALVLLAAGRTRGTGRVSPRHGLRG
jgi:uncharacterized membrane protein YbhN (UPF0104 family)